MAAGVAQEMSDAALVGAVREGDTRAFSCLYSAHVGAVRTVVRDNVHQRETLDDVVQEVFARALERLGSLRQPEAFRPWLLSIARHAAVDERRQRGRVGTIDDDGGAETIAGDGLGPDAEAELSELCRLVNGRVAGLSRRDATALSLAMHLGYTPTEVATVLGVTPGAAKVILHRARHRLRDAVALEVLVRGHSTDCPELRRLAENDDPLPAARHVHACATCQAAAAAEVQLYEWPAPAAGGRVTPQGPPPAPPCP